MNIQDLMKLDLQKIDLNKLIKLLLDQKQLLVQLIVIAAFIMTLIGLAGLYQEQKTQTQQQTQEFNSKIEVIKEYENVLKQLKSAESVFPQEIDEDQISSEVSDYATQTQVNILSFSSGARKSENLSDVISFQISVKAKTYKSFLAFLQAIESSPYALKVEACSIVPIRGDSTESAGADNDNQDMDVQMTISYITVKR